MSFVDVRNRWGNKLRLVDWYLCFGLVFLFLVICGLATGIWKLNIVLNDADTLPIEAVAIKGDRQFTSDEEIRVALQDLMQRSFFSADVNQVQQALEALPWVYQASVRREWPAKLKVYLVEQRAVAHWNASDWLNEQGQVFQAPMKEGVGSLPSLAGPEEQALSVLTNYRQVSELLNINGFNLTRLELSPRHAWLAVLENGIELKLGREDKMARVQRFINVYPTLVNQSKPVARVDLRYDTGLAVGWDEAQNESH
ncbi:cell division protein FtsQ/DivIB [Shewanella colwelliana]|uniref:cell division protein FtsQ/DivIB n=1 Tax=Shewanella colwelliana TaxID=23 RepID=UPI0022AF3854|nr:cell division protein FtsQ/DivIB [Shewanella colwelliana]MCZ4337833.1 cell division protein FtsQ/DivIB [Shewanella colwelliana]